MKLEVQSMSPVIPKNSAQINRPESKEKPSWIVKKSENNMPTIFVDNFGTVSVQGCLEIKRDSWCPIFTSVFRKISILDYVSWGQTNNSSERLTIEEIAPSIASQINEIKFQWFEDWTQSVENLPQVLTDFLIQFTNLNTLKFDLYFEEFQTVTVKPEDFEEIIKNLQDKTTVIFKIRFPFNFDLNMIKNYITKLSKLPNVYFKIDPSFITNSQALEDFTNLILEHALADRIRKLNIYLQMKIDTFPDDSKSSVLGNLKKLSPYLTFLGVSQSQTSMSKRGWNIFESVWNFPSLQTLIVQKYYYPLSRVLQNCPNLEDLTLEKIDQNACIFTNCEISNLQNLKDCFGRLENLSKLNIYGKNGDKIFPGTKSIKNLFHLFPKCKINLRKDKELCDDCSCI